MGSVPVSVIIPSYNSQDYLLSCVRSINTGSELPDEVVIVDDCSTDSSLQLALSLENQFSNVRLVRRERNGGAAEARRSGLRCARNDIVAIVDADDLIDPGAVVDAFNLMAAAHADMCIWDLWAFDDESRWRTNSNPPSFPLTGMAAAAMTLGGWGCHPLGLAKKELYVASYDDFRETYLNADELVTRLILRRAGKIVGSNKRYLYRQHPASTTRANEKQSERLVSAVRSNAWLLEFAQNVPGSPMKKMTLDAIYTVRQLWMERKQIGPQASSVVCHYLPRILMVSSAWRWLWQHPKYFGFAIYLTARTSLIRD
jgi:glycosyltransferase involved in cell wall biosynthesis